MPLNSFWKYTIAMLFMQCMLSTIANGQYHLNGTLSAHAQVEIRLKGFVGFEEQVFSQDTIDLGGHFTLNYPEDYRGMGALEVKGVGSLLLILANEKEISLSGTSIQDYAALTIKNSPENAYLDTYIQQQNIRNRKLDGWKWLQPMYFTEDKGKSEISTMIQKEIVHLEKEGDLFLSSISKDKYAKSYIQLRKLIEERPASVKQYVERIPQHIKAFYAYDLGEKDLWQSGLINQFYEGHFVMLENVYGVTDSGYVYINESIDHIISNLASNDDKLIKVSEFLFKLFEKRSLFPAAKYLSLQMLEQKSCTIDGELERRFEQYRLMKEGNVATDILFSNNAGSEEKFFIKKGFKNQENKLSEIDSEYKLVTFWASWCQHCQEEIPKLHSLYPLLQEKNIEVISISMDTDAAAFEEATKNHNWYSYCDFQKWDSPPVKDYYIFSTPSFYLLDRNQKIIKKIGSVAQLETLVKNKI